MGFPRRWTKHFGQLSLAGAWLVACAVFWIDAAAQVRQPAIVLDVKGPIGPATTDYLARGLQSAAERGAPVVILHMDTPGGLDTSMRDIIRDILASPVPVATFVAPSGARAASAGTYILYASHIAAMAAGTNTGAATPVAISSGFDLGRDEEEAEKEGDAPEAKPVAPKNPTEAKAVNDAVAYIRSLAEMRGRNADWAESAVREAASISADEALRRNVIDLVVPDMEALLARIDGRTVNAAGQQRVMDTEGRAVERIEPDWRTRVLSTITNPSIVMILMMIGLYGLIFEFWNPGALYPGVIGAVCLLIALYGLAALPLNYAGLALIVLGLALIVAEIFSPSFGILGIGGTVAFILGASVFFDTGAPGFEVPWSMIAGVGLTTLAFMLLVGRMALSSHRRKVVSGQEEMIGMMGRVDDWAGTSGHIRVHGERWNARAQAPLATGQGVRVIRMDGLTLTVEPVDATS